jgi:hypothetical protein
MVDYYAYHGVGWPVDIRRDPHPSRIVWGMAWDGQWTRGVNEVPRPLGDWPVQHGVPWASVYDEATLTTDLASDLATKIEEWPEDEERLARMAHDEYAAANHDTQPRTTTRFHTKVIDEWIWTCGGCGKVQGWRTTSEVGRLECCGHRQGVMRRVLEPPRVTWPTRPGGKAPPPKAPPPRHHQGSWIEDDYVSKSVQGADGKLYTFHYVACGPGRCIVHEGPEPIDATKCPFCGKKFIPDVRPAPAASSGGTVPPSGAEILNYQVIGISSDEESLPGDRVQPSDISTQVTL